MVISLIGYRGTGKTTVGSLLAERLGWSCIDTDVQVEQQSGVTIRQLFESYGEEYFRNYEAQIVQELTRQFKLILSLGGGAILRKENRKAISMAGPVVWLTAPPLEIYRRICDDSASFDNRPNLTDQGGLSEIETVLHQRKPIYSKCADLTVDTEGKSPRQIVDEIIAGLDLTSQLSID